MLTALELVTNIRSVGKLAREVRKFLRLTNCQLHTYTLKEPVKRLPGLYLENTSEKISLL